MLKLDAMLPRNRTVVIDSGHSMGWPIIYLSAPDAAGFVFSNDFMAVGLGLGTAFGAAIAHPDRLTVCSPGDGGLMMSLGELETFVRYQIPALVIVINDASYGAEVHLLKNVGLPWAWGLLPRQRLCRHCLGHGRARNHCPRRLGFGGACVPGLTSAPDRWLSIAKWIRSCAATGSAKSSLLAVGISACMATRI